jgi:hypothetical protein
MIEKIVGWIPEDDILTSKPVAPCSPRIRAIATTDTALLIVDHNGPDVDATYGVSFNGCNPELDDYIQCATEEDALRLLKILGCA